MLQSDPNESRNERVPIIDEILSPLRVKIAVVLLATSIAIFFAAMAIPIDTSQQKTLLSEGKSLLQSATSGSSIETFVAIFLNNIRVALIEMIPAVGFVFWSVSLYTTGQVLQAFSLDANIPPFATGLITFAFPHGLVEFAGYAFAVTESVMLIFSGVKHRLRAELRIAGFEILLVAGTLVLAAVVETVEIVSPGVGLLMWVPVILIVVAVVRKVRHGTPRWTISVT
jgi:hypothetical protein